MNEFSPWLALLAIPILLLLFSPLAYRSGKAKAERIRGLRDDLVHGRTRGFLIVLVVVVLFIIAQIDFAMRN